MSQVGRNEDLLNTARDCFCFLIKFFEPINASATHIYHSALELSPLSSIVRRLYYHQRLTLFPKVVIGIPDAWDSGTRLPGTTSFTPFTWSPCGQFVATETKYAAEIRDPLSSELLTNFPKPILGYGSTLAYSPNGYSLALLSDTSLTIWDIQTGGVIRHIEWYCGVNAQLVWSLDGGTIATISQPKSPAMYDQPQGWFTHTHGIVQVYNIASGTTSTHTLQSDGRPHLWAKDESFQVMTTTRDDEAYTIDISEVGSTVNKIESFKIQPWRKDDVTKSFSPATYQISISTRNGICVLNVQNSKILLEKEGRFYSHCFSPNGNFFAAYQPSHSIQIWKYTSNHYILWREIAWAGKSHTPSPLQLSPTLSAIMGGPHGILQVWHLDGPSIATSPKKHNPLAVFSCCGAYMATCQEGDSTVTITNLHSQTTSQSINTDMEVEELALTCNVLSTLGSGIITAWQLTEEGVVDGVFGNREAGCSDAIWAVPAPTGGSQTATVVDQSVVISDGKPEQTVWHAYHMKTGEILEPSQASKSLSTQRYSYWARRNEPYHLHCYKLKHGTPPKGDWSALCDTVQEGWVKDPEGRHQLWIPAEWRVYPPDVAWCYKVRTLQLHPSTGMVAIVFQLDPPPLNLF